MSGLSYFFLTMTLAILPAEESNSIQVRETVQKSIPYIEERGEWWKEKKKCASCHRTGTMVWSLTAARARGFKVSDRVDEWVNWTTDDITGEDDKGKVVGLSNKQGIAQALLALRADEKKDSHVETIKNLTTLLKKTQSQDGTFEPDGQLSKQKRSIEETTAVNTMWLVYALIEEEGLEKNKEEIKKAKEYISNSEAGKSTEWYAMQLLLASQAGSKKQTAKYLKKLQSFQKEDGGWGFLVNDESDALGTGYALYALVKSGVALNHQSIHKAQKFLTNSQKEDGTWEVKGTKESKKEEVAETAVYWGTTWAVISLIESLPKEN